MVCLKILSVLLFISIVKCNLMSKSELEDFSNFLKRTSVLDQTLKKAPGVGAFDEDEPISDVNAWEESGKFEGDLILNDRQRKVIVETVAEGLSRNGLNDITKRWPDNMVVFYIQREHFNGAQVRAILEGIEDLARASCVKFRPYRKGDRDAVVVQGSRRGCFSQVGYQGGYQVLNLSGRHPVGRGCFRHGTIVHEFLHTLGFYHMQSSPDRDDYIKVNWENIVEPAKHNFRKYNSFSVSDFGVGYDYDSVLHYSRKAFSSNGQDTLVPKQDGADIGQRIALSDKDTQKLNKMYCDAENDKTGDEHGPIIQRASKKKRKFKNLPFDGHGIGYHQGKTLVIKVPTTTTIQVTSLPIYRSFDYSSKLPTTPVVQRVGTGQEVVYWSYPYSSQSNHGDTPHPKYRTDPQKFTDKNNDSRLFIKTPSTVATPKSNIVKINEHKVNRTSTEDFDEKSKKEEVKTTESAKHDELTAAIKRLEELVKTRLIPIEYKPNYTKFYNPDFKFESEPEIKKVDKLFKESSLPKKITKPESKSNSHDTNTARNFIENLHSDVNNDTLYLYNTTKTEKKEHLEMFTPEMDSSYRTTYPFNELDYHKGNHELAEYKYDPINKLSDKHNYSNLYFPTQDTKQGAAIKTHLKVFGEDTNPIKDPKWYRKVELDNTPLKYDKNRYTYYGPDIGNKPEKLHSSDSSNNNKEPGYSLFGKSVPTNSKWFREHTTDKLPIKVIQENTTSNKFDLLKTSENVDTDDNSESEEIGDEIDKYSKPVVTTEKWFEPYLNQDHFGDNNSRNESDKKTFSGNSKSEEFSDEDNDKYTGPKNSTNKSENLRSGDFSDENKESTRGYFLFGKSFPIKFKWFKENTAYKPPIKLIQSTFYDNTATNKSDLLNTSENSDNDVNSASEEVKDEIDTTISDKSEFGKAAVTNDKWFEPYAKYEQVGENSAHNVSQNSESEEFSTEDHKSNDSIVKYPNYMSKEYANDSHKENERKKLHRGIYSIEDEGIKNPVTSAFEKLYKEFENYDPSDETYSATGKDYNSEENT